MSKKKNVKIDFIGIGAARCGTTWISKCLAEHPQICFSKPKETGFFNRRVIIFKKPNIFINPEKCYSEYYKKGIEGYAKYFSHCKEGQIKGEWTVEYLHEPSVAKNIKKEFPDVKILVSLRNPIDRAYGHFYFAKYSQGFERCCQSFEEAFEKHPNFYKYFSLYFSQLKEYFELFPRENILVLIYEDIKKDPLKFIQNIYRFLGVDYSFVPPSLNERVNPTIKPVRPHFFKIYHPVLKALRKRGFRSFIDFLKQTKVGKLTSFIWAKEVIKRPPMNPETRKYLQQVFAQDIKNLEELIGRDLSFWK